MRVCGQILSLSALLGAGCVMVETPDVRVGVVGSASPRAVAEPEPGAKRAELVQRVVAQQDKLTKELQAGDWAELHEEAGQWAERIRELRTHAGASSDPARCQKRCDELLTLIQTLRQAARHKDPAGCTQLLDACDGLVNDLANLFAGGGGPTPQTASGRAEGQAKTPARMP